MKIIKKYFLVINGTLILIFILTSQVSILKKGLIKNCYQSVSGTYLSSCPSAIWLSLSCLNKTDLLNNPVKNDISYSDYTTTYKQCSGGLSICCIKFASSGTVDPCINESVANEKQGDGIIRDGNDAIIPSTDYVKIIALECKAN